MKKTRLQVYKLVQATAVNPSRQAFYLTLDDTYKYCTGIAFVRRAGAGTYVKMALEDESIKIIDDIPLHLAEIALGSLGKDNCFLPVFFESAGNTVRIIIDYATVTTGFDMEVIFRLETMPETPKKIIQFQYKLATIPEKTYGIYDNTAAAFMMNTAYDRVIAAVLYSATNIRFAIKNEGGEYLLNRVPKQLLHSDTDVPYMERGFPLDLAITSKLIHYEFETFSELGTSLEVPVTLFLEKTLR